MTDAKSSPQARGERLRRIRNLANLSRTQICERGGLNYNTFKGWELGRFGGLTKSGARRVCARLTEVGVICTIDWLLDENGLPPEVTFRSECSHSPSIDEQQQDLIEELNLFHKHFPQALDYRVTDDSMSPQFNIGDVVAGAKTSDHEKAIGYAAIIRLNNDKTLLRMVKQNPHNSESLTLLSTNLDSQALDLILLNADVQEIAPVLWHRKAFMQT